MRFPIRQCILSFLILIALCACAPAPQPVYQAPPAQPTADDSFNAGVRAFRNADFKEAVAYFEDALRARPNFADAAFYLGKSYEMLSIYDRAESAYWDCINMDSRYLPAYESLGLLLFRSERYGEAEKELRAAQMQRSVMPEVYYSLGEIYRMKKQCRDAMEAYREAFRLNPSYRAARDGYALAQRACRGPEPAPREEKTFKGGGKAIRPEDF